MTTKETLLNMAGKLVLLDASYHPESDSLVEVCISFGEDGHHDEKITYILDHGNGEYSTFADLNDLMRYLDSGVETTLCKLTQDEYLSLDI